MKLELSDLLLIFYLQTALSALVAGFVLVRFRLRPLYVKLIGLSFFLGFLTHIIILFLRTFMVGPEIRNKFQNVYEILNFCILTLVYYIIFKKKHSKYFGISVAAFLAFSLCNMLFFQKEELNSYTIALSSFLMMGYFILYFYRLMVELPSLHLHRLPMFWFNSGFLIYRAGTLLLFIFRPYLIHVLNDDLLLYWSFHNSLSIVEQLIVLVGLHYDLQWIKNQSTSNVELAKASEGALKNR